jgi:hypothetical protein
MLAGRWDAFSRRVWITLLTTRVHRLIPFVRAAAAASGWEPDAMGNQDDLRGWE